MDAEKIKWLEFWIQVGGTITSCIIASIVAYIAWSQHELAKYKFNWDMFDRRMKAFEAIKKIIGLTLQLGNFPLDQDFNEFWRARAESNFIFEGDVIPKYFDLIWQQGCDLHTVEKLANSREALANEEKRIQYLDQRKIHFAWFAKQSKEHIEIFKPFLTIKK